MNLSGVNIQQAQQANTSKHAVLKEGQIMHGTIKKLFPDQMAEVQVGNQKMMARLETSLKAGDTHFFQISSTSPDLSLKVVSGPITSQSTSQQAQQLMTNMNLPDSKEMRQLVQQFLKNDVPMSKEQLIQAEQVLKATNVPKDQALAAMEKIIQLKLPMNEASLQAIVQGGAKTGFQNNLQTLQQAIQQDRSIPADLKQTLLNNLLQIQKPLALESGTTILGNSMTALNGTTTSATMKQSILALLKAANVLPQNANLMNYVSNALGKADPNPTATVQQTLQQLQANPTSTQAQQKLQQAILNHTGLSASAKEALLTDLARVQLSATPKFMNALTKATTAALSNAAPQTVAQALSGLSQGQGTLTQQLQNVQTAVQQDPQLTTAQKEAMVTQLQTAGNMSSDTLKNVQQQFMQLYGQHAGKQAFQTGNEQQSARMNALQLLGVAPQQMDEVLQKITYEAAKSSNVIVQQLLQQAEAQLEQQVNGKAFDSILRHTLQSLGLNYEADLANKLTDKEQLQQQLKPQLMALLQDGTASSTTKQAAEQLVARMNGMHYLSGENGPQHQLIMQVPLEFFGKKTDATLQWNGTMKENGKIDADYARVMFYLNLGALKETIIDMHVQSRVVNVTVYNENEQLAPLIEPLKASLSKGLEAHQYQLSGVSVKPYEREKVPAIPTLHATDSDGQGGVDLRI